MKKIRNEFLAMIVIVLLSSITINIKAQEIGDYRSKADGAWTLSGNWERYIGGNEWESGFFIIPGLDPLDYDYTVYISENTTITITTDTYYFKELIIYGKLQITKTGGQAQTTCWLPVTEFIFVNEGTFYVGNQVTIKLPENASLSVIIPEGEPCDGNEYGLQGHSNNSFFDIGEIKYAVQSGGGNSEYLFSELNCAGGSFRVMANANPLCICVNEENIQEEVLLSGIVEGIIEDEEDPFTISYKWSKKYPHDTTFIIFSTELNPEESIEIFDRSDGNGGLIPLEDVFGYYYFELEGLFSKPIFTFRTNDVIRVEVYPTLDFGLISHDPEELQDGESAIIILTGLWKNNTDFMVYYTIDGVVEVPVTVTSDNEGVAFFETRALFAEEHHNTFIVITAINEIAENGGDYYEIANPCVMGLKQTHLHFEGHIPLPVELVEFNAICKNNHALINWTTATEINNDFFILEKSRDMVNFEKIAKIKGHGFSNTNIYYTYTDKNPFHGINYYRLTQVDYDGTSETFSPVFLNCEPSEDEKAMVNVYPNPFNHQINLVFENLNSQKVLIEIYDELGRFINAEIIYPDSGYDTKVLNMSEFAYGFYYLRIISENEIFNKRIIKR